MLNQDRLQEIKDDQPRIIRVQYHRKSNSPDEVEMQWEEEIEDVWETHATKSPRPAHPAFLQIFRRFDQVFVKYAQIERQGWRTQNPVEIRRIDMEYMEDRLVLNKMNIRAKRYLAGRPESVTFPCGWIPREKFTSGEETLINNFWERCFRFIAGERHPDADVEQAELPFDPMHENGRRDESEFRWTESGIERREANQE